MLTSPSLRVHSKPVPQIFFVYKWIDVSDIQSAPCGKLASYQIAAIGKEVSNEEVVKEFAVLKTFRFLKVSITYTKSLELRIEQ